jgi:hypothetical protein
MLCVVQNMRERQTNILTMQDIEDLGMDKVSIISLLPFMRFISIEVCFTFTVTLLLLLSVRRCARLLYQVLQWHYQRCS